MSRIGKRRWEWDFWEPRTWNWKSQEASKALQRNLKLAWPTAFTLLEFNCSDPTAPWADSEQAFPGCGLRGLCWEALPCGHGSAPGRETDPQAASSCLGVCGEIQPEELGKPLVFLLSLCLCLCGSWLESVLPQTEMLLCGSCSELFLFQTMIITVSLLFLFAGCAAWH